MSKCFLATLLVLLSSLSSAALVEASPDVLIAVNISDSGAMGTLREMPVSVNYRGYGYLVATVDTDDIERLKKAGIEYEVIDDEAWSEPYFLITRPKAEALGQIPDQGEVLFQTESEAFVKITLEEVLEFGRAGFQLTRIFPKSLPLWEDRAEEKGRIRENLLASRQTEDVIGAIVNQISQEIMRSDVQRLQDFQTRLWASDSLWASAQWIYDRFVEYGYTDVVFEDFVISGNDPIWYQQGYDVPVRNVVATKPGVLHPEDIVIIGGHYDSIVFDGTNPFVWAPGADDNASAIAAMLEAARILADVDLECTVKFACWTAEEVGLYGAWYHAAQAYDRGENIVLNINLDMISYQHEGDPERDVTVYYNPSAQAYADLMSEMANTYTTLVPVPRFAGGGSDHVPFMQYGYDIVYAEEGDFFLTPHWHISTDVVENMDFGYMGEVVKMSLATLVTVAGPPATLVVPEPVLGFESYVMDEDDEGGSSGNENGYFDAGETIQLSVTLSNHGDAQATDVTGRLAIDDPYVTVLDDVVPYENIPPGGAGTSQSQFRFLISEDCPSGHFLNFSLHTTASGGITNTTYFSVRVIQPTVVYISYDLEEMSGDGDGNPEPGETVEMSLLLGNGGLRGASGIVAELSTEDGDITVLKSEIVFPDMATQSVAENTGERFSFSVNAAAALHTVDFTVRLSEGKGYYRIDIPIRWLMGQGTVRLVADDGGGYFGYYIEALQNVGVPFDIDEIQGVPLPHSVDLKDYAEVIWFTGADESNTLTPEDQNDLQDFLDNGGRLLLSGCMIGYEIGTTPFYRNYLHGSYVSFMTMLHHLNSAASNPVQSDIDITLARDGYNGQAFTGEVDPISPAVSIFDYDRSTEEGPGIVRSSGSGALAVETSVYKLAYFSFGLEGIVPTEDCAQVIADVLAWFKEPGIDKGDVDGNGATDIIDAVVAVNIVLGMHQPDEDQMVRADMNYDGAIDIIDVVRVVNAVLGTSGRAVHDNDTDM
ncbi:MAG: M20/M25/M40 family metallo-hydrolase [Gemmatimonadota bacterium]|nr:MAG: M20/M25/M40 family metallo-hydrolase [Gemmatimonadota bacterium]